MHCLGRNTSNGMANSWDIVCKNLKVGLFEVFVEVLCGLRIVRFLQIFGSAVVDNNRISIGYFFQSHHSGLVESFQEFYWVLFDNIRKEESF